MNIDSKFFWATLPIAILITSNFHRPVLAETELTEIEEFCAEFPSDSICKNQESYISLDEWKKNKTECSLATEWGNEKKKCKIIANNNVLTVYVENGAVSESLTDTLKTEAFDISLDKTFVFDAQWWLANYNSAIADSRNFFGSFPSLKIGFVSTVPGSEYPNRRFLTVSARTLHRTMEDIESWRYYLPDMSKFEGLAFNPRRVDSEQSVADNIAKLENTNECPFCNLENANLTEIDLEKANLEGANLAGANLAGSKLKKAFLLGANFDRANLYEANLEEANMMFASLKNSDLSKTNLKGTNLQNANLNEASLNGAELKAKKLENTSLKNASLIGADLSEANLQCVDFQSADLTNANLSSADLSSCQDESINVPSHLQLNNTSHFKNLGFGGTAKLVSGILGLVGAGIQDIKNPQSTAVTDYQTDLNNSVRVTFYLNSNLASANLKGANLTNTNLKSAQLMDVNLSQAIFDSTKFEQNNLSNANFLNADVSEVNFKNPYLICEAVFADELVYEEYCYEE